MNICSRALGGVLSDIVARRYGMRGRLWFLWFTQTASGGVCVAMAQSYESLSASTATMVIFSFLTQMSCGATYGIVPFISRRSLGVISGMVGAGGNGVSGLLQQVFFTGRPADQPYTGLQHLGISIMCCTLLLTFVHFPMWGSMFFGPTRGKEGTEAEFYLRARALETPALHFPLLPAHQPRPKLHLPERERTQRRLNKVLRSRIWPDSAPGRLRRGRITRRRSARPARRTTWPSSRRRRPTSAAPA